MVHIQEDRWNVVLQLEMLVLLKRLLVFLLGCPALATLHPQCQVRASWLERKWLILGFRTASLSLAYSPEVSRADWDQFQRKGGKQAASTQLAQALHNTVLLAVWVCIGLQGLYPASLILVLSSPKDLVGSSRSFL